MTAQPKELNGQPWEWAKAPLPRERDDALPERRGPCGPGIHVAPGKSKGRPTPARKAPKAAR